MTQYARPLGHDRLAEHSKSTERRLKSLESRTAGIDSGMPLALLPGVISGSYTSGDPMVVVNGAATATGPYQHLASYTPAANDSVVLAPVGGALKAYIVLGKLA